MKRTIISLIIQLLILLLILLGLKWAFTISKVNNFEYEPEPKLFVRSRKMPPVETRTLASKANIEGLYAISTRRQGNDPKLKYKTLITCVSGQESSRNKRLYGDPRWKYGCNNMLFESEYCSFGCLQFWQGTFKHYCMEKHDVTDDPGDIFDCSVQKKCMDEMVTSNWYNLSIHWKATYKACLN